MTFDYLSGVASLGEVAVLAIILPLVGFIATKLFTLQNDLLYLKGNRIKILNEIVGGIKVCAIPPFHWAAFPLRFQIWA